MKPLIKENKLYFIILVSLLILGLIPLLGSTKAQSFLWINQHHNKLLDFIFYYWTSLGNGFAYLVLFVIMITFKSYRNGLMILMAALMQSFITTCMKELIFADCYRPLKFFSEIPEQFHFVEGVKLHKYHSFPSGHTASAFTTFTILALFTKQIGWKIAFLVLATGVAYSRIYLAQHFIVDTYFGAIIGSFTGLFIYWWFECKGKFASQKNKWINKRILSYSKA